uniref:Phage protein n=1 Tax=Romanomermis culicivorax TaxID=13658 RepID=A0A915HVE3_ROMCU
MAGKFKEISTRRIKPTVNQMAIDQICDYASNWRSEYEMGDITVYDDGVEFLLCDPESHQKYYAALVLGLPSLRCRVIKDAPENCDPKELVVSGSNGSSQQIDNIVTLNNILSKKGYRLTT